jgi:hypothetical protein
LSSFMLDSSSWSFAHRALHRIGRWGSLVLAGWRVFALAAWGGGCGSAVLGEDLERASGPEAVHWQADD